MIDHLINKASWEFVDGMVTEAGDASVVFTGLDGDRAHTYKLISLTHMDPTAENRMRINDDSGSNYTFVYLSFGGTTSNVETKTETEFPLNSGNLTHEQVVTEALITSKNLTNGHTIKVSAGTNGSGAGDEHRRGGFWDSTDEISTISIHANLGILTGGRFAKGCIFELYKLAS